MISGALIQILFVTIDLHMNDFLSLQNYEW